VAAFDVIELTKLLSTAWYCQLGLDIIADNTVYESEVAPAIGE